MAGWITKVSAARASGPSEEPEPFELHCQCGQTVKGERRPLYQRALCKNCGESFFILPTDVYRELQTKKRKKKRKWALRKSKLRATGTREDTATIRSIAAERIGRVRAATANAVAQLAGRTRRTFTPFRLVALSILGVIAATGYWALSTRAMEQAEATFKTASERGYAALQKGDFVIAAEEFLDACKALDIIGRDDHQARVVRQMHREAMSASRLSNESLFEMLNEAEGFLSGDNQDKWKEHFRVNYFDKWIVMQTTLTRGVDRMGQAAYSIEFPLMVGGKLVTFEANLAVFEEFGFTEAAPQSKHSPAIQRPQYRSSLTREVIFAAQIEDCRLSDVGSPTWVIRLRSESAFFWSDYNNYTRLGFRPDDLHTVDRIRQLLSEQTLVMGIKS